MSHIPQDWASARVTEVIDLYQAPKAFSKKIFFYWIAKNNNVASADFDSLAAAVADAEQYVDTHGNP